MSACSTPGCSGDRYGIAEKCVRCLWPEPKTKPTDEEIRVTQDRYVASVAAAGQPTLADAPAEECARCGTVGPVDVPCAGCGVLPSCAVVLETYPRTPAGQRADSDSMPRPTPPCCARIGAWWCLREAGHAGAHATPHTREVTTPAIERGTRSPRSLATAGHTVGCKGGA